MLVNVTLALPLQRIVLFICNGFHPLGRAFLRINFNGNMCKSALFGSAMPMFDMGGNYHNTPCLQLPRAFSPFLIIPAPSRYQQHLPSLMCVPVVTATGCKGHIGNWQGRARWHKHVEPDITAEVAVFKPIACGKYRLNGFTAHTVAFFTALPSMRAAD